MCSSLGKRALLILYRHCSVVGGGLWVLLPHLAAAWTKENYDLCQAVDVLVELEGRVLWYDFPWAVSIMGWVSASRISTELSEFDPKMFSLDWLRINTWNHQGHLHCLCDMSEAQAGCPPARQLHISDRRGYCTGMNACFICSKIKAGE